MVEADMEKANTDAPSGSRLRNRVGTHNDLLGPIFASYRETTVPLKINDTRRNGKLIKLDEFKYNSLPHDILHMEVRKIVRENLKRPFHIYGNKVNAEYQVLLSQINA